MSGTKNLGLVKAIFTGSSAPLQTAAIWYDTVNNIHKYFNGTIWVPLSSGGGSGTGDILRTISISHATLLTFISSSLLVPGQTYKITDFQTIFDRPDYEDVGFGIVPIIVPKAIISTITCTIEPIIVTAISSNQLSHIATSETNENDVIHYQPNYTTIINSAPTKGLIYYREDTVNHVKLDFDYRKITFKRYNHGDGEGHIYYWDDGSYLKPTYIKAISETYTTRFEALFGCEYSKFVTAFDLPNFVLTQWSANNKINAIVNSHIKSIPFMTGQPFHSNFGDILDNSIILGSFFYNEFKDFGESLFKQQFVANRILGIQASTIDCVFSYNTGTVMTECTITASTFMFNSFTRIETTQITVSFLRNIFSVIEDCGISGTFVINNFAEIISTNIQDTFSHNSFTSIEQCIIPVPFTENTFTKLLNVDLTGATIVGLAFSKEIKKESTLGAYWVCYIELDPVIPVLRIDSIQT